MTIMIFDAGSYFFNFRGVLFGLVWFIVVVLIKRSLDKKTPNNNNNKFLINFGMKVSCEI